MSTATGRQPTLFGRGEARRAVATLLAVLTAVLLLAALAVACPGVALAGATDTGSCHIEDAKGNVIFDGTGFGPWEAWGWVQGEGKFKDGIIVMDSDWTLGAQMTLSAGNSVTIRMNGHKISRSGGEVAEGCIFWLKENSTLTLDGSDKPNTEFVSVQVYTGESYTSTTRMNLTSGGLLTGGHSNNSGGAVEMKAGATLNLKSILVAGNKAYTANGGAVRMDGANCKLNMTDSAIEYNVSEVNWWHTAGGDGGGVYSGGERTDITMSNSSISHNAAQIGGGVYANNAYATIAMERGSAIEHNRAIGSGIGDNSGGGIQFDSSDFKLVSEDRTASVSYNECVNARGGAIRTANSSNGEIRGITFKGNRAPNAIAGAIYADASDVTISRCVFDGNSSGGSGGAVYGDGEYLTVIDCTFTGNTTSGDAGALYLNHSEARVRRCTFTNNKATGDKSEGGAIYNSAGNMGTNKLDTCTITGNYATVDGGGVFVDSGYCLDVVGVLRIYGNTRQGGSPDDLFLHSVTLGGKARLDGSVQAGSWIGVRTDDSGKYEIVKFTMNYIEGTYFMDLPESFYLEYDSSESILYQKAASAKTFDVKLNGATVGSGTTGAEVQVNAADDAYAQGKAFWCWDEAATKGLSGLEDLNTLTGGDLTKPQIALTVPGNDVTLSAKYVAYLTSAELSLEAPVPGEDLPIRATLTFTEESGQEHIAGCPVTWKHQLTSSGAFANARGKAAYNTTYSAWVSVPVDFETGLVPYKLAAENVEVHMGAEAGAKASSVLVGSAGTTITTQAYTTPRRVIASVGALDEVDAHAGICAAELAELMPETVPAVDADGHDVALTLVSTAPDVFDWDRYGILDEQGKVAEPDADTDAVRYTVTLGVVGLDGEAVELPDGLSTVSVDVVVRHPACTVTADAANGLGASRHTVEWGDTLEGLDAPEREGHDFLGWFEQGSDVEFDFASTPITKDVILVAKWQVKTLTVTFEAPGATPESQSADVEWNTPVGQPAEPGKEHYGFSGWYAADSETPYDFSQAVTSSLTLYAGWTPDTCTVTFDPASGEQAVQAPTAYGTPVEEPDAPTRPGYKFLGWYASDGVEWDFDQPVTGDMTLTARWDITVPAEFVDLTEDWYVSWVYAASARDLMTGYKDSMGNYTGYFGPSDTLTRGQVATVLWRVAGCPNPARTDYFDAGDVDPGTYYAKAVNWCYEKGVITGYKAGPNAGRFLPGNGVTREELATMVYRFAQWAGIETSDVPTANFDRCVDSALVSDWARDASVWCAAANVLGGKEVTEGDAMFYRLDPQWGATRAQAAKVFVTLDNLYGGQAPYEPAQPGDAGTAAGQQAEGFEGAATFDAVEQAETVEQPEAVEEAPVATEVAEEQAYAGFEGVEFDEAA